MIATLRMQLALAAAITLAGFSLLPLTEDRGYLMLLGFMMLVSIGIGAAARALRAPDALARCLQLLPGLVAVWWLWEEWPALISDTADFVAISYAPMAPHDGFRILSVAVLWLAFLAVEALALGLDHPGWTFPVLVLPYLVPAIVLDDETSPVYLALICVGYLLVLGTGVYNRVEPDVGGDRGRLARSVLLAGALTGMVAWTFSGLAATAIPERGSAVFDPGQVNGSVQLGDPTLDLIRNLRSPTGRQIISYTSSDGNGHYLRLAALPALDRTGFHLVPTDLLPGTPDRPPGTSAESTVRLTVKVGDFGSEWLPVPWVPQEVDAGNDWRHDPATGAIVAVGPDRTRATRHLDYSVESILPSPDVSELTGAAAGDPRDGGLTLDLPDELDPQVIALAQKLTQDSDAAGKRVVDLLGWLRSDEFTYSTALVDGSSMDTVSDFLLSSRTGYCEQFAGSLAILARAIGVPSRVVVGFLPGTAEGNHYQVSTKDMHAWTEVFLDGLGWVPLDPTPTGAAGAAPVPTPSPTSTSATPSAEPTIDDVPTTAATPTTAPSEGPRGQGSFRLPGWTGWVAGGLALALLPAALRRWRTWRRLRPGSDPAAAAEDAWDEIRDTVWDLGRPWPAGTPRQLAAELADGLDPTSAATLASLGLAVERARFAPADAGLPPVDPRQVAKVTASLAATAPNWRLLNRLFPRSVFRFPR